LTISSPSSPSSPVESYLITLPRLRIDGLWYGSPYTELADTSHIIGGGHVVTLDYKGKGYFSGKSHSFKATVTPMPGHGGQGRDDVVVEGTWHEDSKFTKGAAGSFHNTNVHFKEAVVPLIWTEESGELETRKLWLLVSKGIREGDFELASREKSRIEVIFIFYTTTTATDLSFFKKKE
jgi:oxysterol-binding protein-related protein 9/10/11